MTTPINEVIRVSLQDAAPTADTDNPNAVMIITSDQGNSVLSSQNRYEIYNALDDVETDFGSLSATTAHARTLLSQSPNPLSAGGSLIIGFWRESQESVPATAATLEGASLDNLVVIDAIRDVSDGSFAITVDGGTEEEVTGLDFSAVTSLADIASKIDGGITGASATAGTDSITITSDTTGSTSELTYLSEASSGTFIGDLLALTDGSGAVLTQGEASDTLSAETKVEALDALSSEVGFRGAMFIDQTTDGEVSDLASWAQSNGTLLYDVFTGTGKFDLDTSANPVWAATQAGQTNYRMLYRKDGNRKFASAYMGRAHTVNFAAENTALTMHLKTLNGITPESFTGTELSGADTVGLDVYVETKDRPWLRTSGANDYTDNRYNLLAFVDAVETDLFNFLGSTGTKFPQTEQGVQALVDRGEKTTRRFVRAGVFAPGEWLRSDFFGDRDTFLRNIREFGYFWHAGDLADQTSSERSNRESPPLQVAVKNAGAIHSADVIIVFDE